MNFEQCQTVAPFFDGAISKSGSDATLDVVNPATGARLFSIPRGSELDVARAVSSARAAFADGRWSQMPPSARKEVLHRLADKVASEATELDALDAAEMGKPVITAFANAVSAARLMRFYAEAIDKITGDVYSSDARSLVVQRRVPRGVVAAVVPWNFPTYNAVLKIAPALAAGNCVVLKPSELSSRSALRIAQLAHQCGLPPGVLNVVPGEGEIVGKALGLHDDVDMMTFTGSTAVGKAMLQYSGQSNMKVVMAECGGKSPQILFDDGVDLNDAIDSISRTILTNQGQICSAGSRLLVQRSIADAVVDKLAWRFEQVVMGDPLDSRTTFGPIASIGQCERVMRYIDSAHAQGAELVIGGHRARMESGGFFVEPTLFRNVSPDSDIAQREIFGPVLSVICFDSEEEAVRIANSTMYGLMAYVWTASLARGLRVGKAMRSAVRINAVAPVGEGAGHMTSFEPAGHSGIGVEGGLAGLENYFRRQLLAISH